MRMSHETLLSLSYKLGAIAITFVGVSLLVRNMGPAAYGAWATLASTLIWIQLSDFGIGLVVRNRVASGRMGDEIEQSVAAAMKLTTGIALVLIAVYAATWRTVSVARDFPVEAALMYVSAFLMLPASVGLNILQGLGLSRVTFKASLVQLSLWLVFVVTLGARPSITWLAAGFSALWIGLCLYQLWRALRELGLVNARFLRRLVQPGRSGELSNMLRVGGAFFLLQITSLVLFNLGTYLSYTSFSPAAAAKYDILNKIYQIPLTLFNVVITVAWSRITREAVERNAARLKTIQRTLLAVALGGAPALFLVSGLVVGPFVHLYSHGQIEVSLREVMAFSALVAIQLLAYAAAVFMNAVERLRIQIIFALASALLFVPVFQALRSAGLEVASVPLSTAIVMLPGALWFNVYVRHRIIHPLRTPVASVDASAGSVLRP